MRSNIEAGLGPGLVKSPVKALLLALPMMLLSPVLLSQGVLPSASQLIPFIITYLFLNTIFYLMIVTGKVDRYRSILFVAYAVCFIIFFISNLLEVRGTMVLTAEKILKAEAPFCHMVIPMIIIPAAFTRTIIFPGSLLEGFASIASMFVIWIGASLTLGRGFCSWGCFYGGLEEGFSRVPALCRWGKPQVKLNPRWRLFPYAVLLTMVLISLASLSPAYCTWLCPFKAVSEFEAITSTKILIQTIIFGSLFIGLVIVLPLLTRKRTQCTLLCPFGAFQSFTNKIDGFNIRVDRERCSGCGHCIQVCPVLAMDEAGLAKGTPNLSCIKCGKCVDQCPRHAISFHIKGTAAGKKAERARILFIYTGFLFLSTFSGGMIQGALVRVFSWITTGKLF